MSKTAMEIIRICESLPPDKQAVVADFAQFLLVRQENEAWEQRIAEVFGATVRVTLAPKGGSMLRSDPKVAYKVRRKS